MTIEVSVSVLGKSTDGRPSVFEDCGVIDAGMMVPGRIGDGSSEGKRGSVGARAGK